MSAYPRHAGVEQAVLDAHELEQTPFFGALARQYGAGKARELTLVATAGRWNAENNGQTHDEAKARLFVHNALLSAGVTDAEAAKISQSFPLSAFDRAQIAHNGSGASLGHITAQAAAKADEAKSAKNRYHDLSALMAGTAFDNPEKAKSFFDAKGKTAIDRMGSGGEGSRGDYSSIKGEYDPQKGFDSLTPHNFDRSPFAQAGLDFATTMALRKQGFGQQQIIQAGQDRAYLGLADKQSAEDLAHIRKANPNLIKSVKSYHDQAGSAAEEHEKARLEAEKAQHEGREEDAKRARLRMQEIEDRQRKERAHRAEQARSPDIRKRMNRTMEKDWDHCKNRAHGAFRDYSDDPEKQKDLDRTAQAARMGNEEAKRKLAKMREDAEKSGDHKKVAALDKIHKYAQKADSVKTKAQDKVHDELVKKEHESNRKSKLLAMLPK